MTQSDISNLSFEEAMEELENVVRQLETGKIKLDEAVAAYERGMALRKVCEEKLTSAKSKIDMLILDKDNHPVQTEPFNAKDE